LFSVATLNLWPTAEAAEARIRARLEGAVELGVGTLNELVRAADEPIGVRLGSLGERLLIDEVAERAAGSLEKIARSRGLRRSLKKIFSSLRRVGMSAEKFSIAARAVGGHAREVSRAYSEYEARLGDRFDEAESFRRGCARIADKRYLRELEGVARVDIRGVHDWDGARLALLDALLARGLHVRIVLPATEQPTLLRALAPCLSALESRHELALEVVREPLPRAATRPAFIAAANPFSEAREVARRARDLVDKGAAPESIVICAESDARRALIAEALSRYGLPVAERRRSSATAAPPVRLALSLLELADERIGRASLIALASSRYIAPGELPAHRLARVLREAGVVDAEAWQEPLAAWATRHEARQRDAERVASRLRELLEILRGLPAIATLNEHCVSLRRALERLDLPARTRGFASDGNSGPAETRALARDQAALRALELVLDDLPRAAARLSLDKNRIARARFARLLDDSLSEGLRSFGVRGAAIEVTDLSSLAERNIAHLFICGLVNGELPARPPEDPLLDDDERIRLNRVMGKSALPLEAGGEDRSSLAFFCALGAGEVTLSWTRTDEEGAPQLRSPLIDDLGARDKEILPVARDPLPRVAEARTLDELTARVALEVRGDRNSRLSLPDREASTELYRLLTARAPARVARLEHLAQIERQRERFFADDAPPHPAVGGLRDSQLLASLLLPGRAEQPLSASAVESYAACHFQFFLRSVLRAAPYEEVDEELDPLAAGRLHHRVLERIFRRLSDEHRLPLTGDQAEKALVRQAYDEAVAEWRRENPIGHPALFAVWERRLRTQIEALIENERQNPPAPGCVPARFEHKFGPLPIVQGEERLFVHGTMDRIDIGPGRAVVLDYKSGGKYRYSSSVKEEKLCDTAWQLPIYAAAAQSELPSHEIEARFYSLRDVATTDAVKPAAKLGDALFTLHRSMKSGDFTVRPRDEKTCERCRMEAACRVIRAVDDLPEEEP
jgi:ATP-dependent helicase/DNAse subunit B